MKNTIVVNILAGSGAGKSTNAARIFAILKDMGVEVELVTEYVKDMVWEGRLGIFDCQSYIFGKQLYKLQRISGKVDVIVTDRPILLDAIYDPEQDEDFRKYILKKFNQFDNFNIFLNRNKPFNPNGRNEKTIDEALVFDQKIKTFLNHQNIEYYEFDGDKDGCDNIISIIVKILEAKNEI